MAGVRAASRAELLGLIASQERLIGRLQRLVAEQQAQLEQLRAEHAEQQAQIERLTGRVRELERELAERPAKGAGRGMPGHKPEEAEAKAKPRKARAGGYARRRELPTDVVVHALANCPDCGEPLDGGSPKWSRQVLEVEPAPAAVVEHVFVERTCRRCRRTWTPTAAAELGGVVDGRQRLGVGLVSLIATLREEARLPVRAIRWYLQAVHGLALGIGTIVATLRRVAGRAGGEAAAILERIRAGPLAHLDETGWRQNGKNGYVWTASTPTERYFTRGGRHKEEVDAILGPAFAGVLLSDFYAADDHYDGLHQRCWAHLLRDIHDLGKQHPADEPLRAWAEAVHDAYVAAHAFSSPDQAERVAAKQRFEAELLGTCRPYLEAEVPQRTLCRRLEKYLGELFVFVLHPDVPSDNNAAERSLRHLVTARKISGGTRSDQGTDTRMTLATVFGTWRARGIDPLLACRQLLTQPQL
jgi:transposase